MEKEDNINAIWGILSDAHGNYLGLQNCIERMEELSVSEFYFLGDAVGYLPMADKVLRILKNKKFSCVKGNHEAMLLNMLSFDINKDKIYMLDFTRKTMNADNINYITSWPEIIRKIDRNSETIMVHGSPDNPWKDYIYPDTDLGPILRDKKNNIIFLGQTHYAFKKKYDSNLVINVGSCGMPRDIPGQASCAIYDPKISSIEILRVPFDPEEVIFESSKISQIPVEVKRVLLGNRE